MQFYKRFYYNIILTFTQYFITILTFTLYLQEVKNLPLYVIIPYYYIYTHYTFVPELNGHSIDANSQMFEISL